MQNSVSQVNTSLHYLTMPNCAFQLCMVSKYMIYYLENNLFWTEQLYFHSFYLYFLLQKSLSEHSV